VDTPKSFLMDGMVWNVVCSVAGVFSWAKFTLPSPLKLKDEVSSCDFSGKRKTNVQVLPELIVGMSKLNIVEIFEFTWPLY